MKSETASSDLHIGFEAAVTAPPPYPAERFAGRGIVICAGGARLFTCAYITVGILRRALGCRLPIQVWHLGPEEIGPPMRALLEEQEVELVDALELARSRPVRTLGGWELKPYAIIHSRFREVLLIDADNVPAGDPSFLFDSPEFAGTGALFWPDVVRLKPDNPIWAICGLPYCNLPTVESGQLVIDKARCWAALHLAMHMNEHSDFYFQYLHGDKDTFFIAWRRLGQAYAMTPHPPAQVQGVLFQRDFAGRTLFQHRTQAKWAYDGQNRRIPGFEHEDSCFELLGELRERWNGRIFLPPAASPAAAAAAAALRRTGRFELVRFGEAQKPIELLDANRIGVGRGDEEYYWHVEEDAEGLCLVIEGRRRTACRLRLQRGGHWSGRSLGADGEAVELHPSREAARTTGTGSAAPPDPDMAARGAALLERLIEAAAPADGESLRDLSGAVRLLLRIEQGLARAIEARLAAGTTGAALDACLRAALERAGDGTQPRAGHGSRNRIRLLGSQYEPIG
jgi:Mannosyltransferase putative